MGFYTEYSRKDRLYSYDFIEKFIEDNVKDWSKWNVDIQTDDIENIFSKQIREMSNGDFEFLFAY